MEAVRIILKIFMWVFIIEFGSNIVMQSISYLFYSKAKKMTDNNCVPEHIQISDNLSGYGTNLDADSDRIILYFGGSNYIAYNSAGCFGKKFDIPFISADYYGSQGSHGRMNLKSLQKTAVDLYDWAENRYAGRKITVMGHSYGAGIAAYLASERECDNLVMLAAYRDLADLYNKIIPIFWGPAKAFITNNINAADYAKNILCPTFIIGSLADRTLSARLQYKVRNSFQKSEVKIFDDVKHQSYLDSKRVIEYIIKTAIK
ncbi:hypothetical protein SDC9_83376 [bioreactor metagenome]|uniref:AB hydrolase-1 domain-containing protein n=1 Tax=bioreactor metagenome TaxID=1076179 RepID=A0A644ZFZ4_9ZZZZ|nr:alpha/beta hydrolase [Oscillospiraceae bacterium]